MSGSNQNPALHYTPGTPGVSVDIQRYTYEELLKISDAFRQLVESGLNAPFTVIDGDTILSGYESLVFVSVEATVTLPTSSGKGGRKINIIRTGTGAVTIATTGSETISGDDELILTSQWDSVVVGSDDSNWPRVS